MTQNPLCPGNFLLAHRNLAVKVEAHQRLVGMISMFPESSQAYVTNTEFTGEGGDSIGDIAGGGKVSKFSGAVLVPEGSIGKQQARSQALMRLEEILLRDHELLVGAAALCESVQEMQRSLGIEGEIPYSRLYKTLSLYIEREYIYIDR